MGNMEVWMLDKQKHMANLTRIQQEARAKGQYGVAAKCEELKGKVQGFYVERNLKCLSEDGRLIIIAVQGGLKGSLNFGYLMRKRYTITGSTLRPQEDKVKALM